MSGTEDKWEESPQPKVCYQIIRLGLSLIYYGIVVWNAPLPKEAKRPCAVHLYPWLLIALAAVAVSAEHL